MGVARSDSMDSLSSIQEQGDTRVRTRSALTSRQIDAHARTAFILNEGWRAHMMSQRHTQTEKKRCTHPF